MKLAILLAATLITSPLAYRSAAGQQVDSTSTVDSAPQVGSGSIVRFMVHGDRHPYSGELSRLTSDSVILHKCFRCSPKSYGRNEISDLQVFRSSTYWRNALFGLVGGAIGAGAVAATIVGSQQCTGDLCGLQYLAIPYAAVAGGVVGLLVGARLASEKWDPVP
jgi:hypothetical protein